MNDKTKTKNALKSQRAATIPAPKRTIDFQVDTIAVDSPETNSAFFTWADNTVTVHYREETDNSYNESSQIKAHEQKHRDNHKAGINNLPMNLEQFYKTDCNDEISANIAGLMQLREEYKNAKTDKEREKIANSPNNSKYSYYFNAVKFHQINPFATNSADFEKEMRFIATETQKMWLRDLNKTYDSDQLPSNVQSHLNKNDYKDLKSNPENYEKARKIAYTIGGIDFTQYMEDIPCINNNIKQADKLIAADKPREEVRNLIKPELFGTQKNLTSLSQQSQLSTLQTFADDLKDTLELRKRWLACTSDEEREAVQHSARGMFAMDWVEAVKKGKIKPTGLTPSAEEQKFLGQELNMFTGFLCSTDLNETKKYINNKGEEAIQKAVQSGEADKNYNNAVKEMFTVDGIDYTKYVKDPIVMEANIALADNKIKNNKPLNIENDIKEFDGAKDLIIPDIKPISGLSMEQQFRLAQHQMYMANVVARNPAIQTYVQKDIDNQTFDMNTPLAEQLKNQPHLFPTDEEIKKSKEPRPTAFTDEGVPISPYITKPKDEPSIFIPGPTFNAEVAESSLQLFQRDLQKNPELKEKWDNAVDNINFNIAEANNGTVFLPSDNDKKYQQELDKIYTINGVCLKNSMADNFKENGSVEKYIPETPKEKIDWIDDVKSRSKTDRLRYKVAKTSVEAKEWVSTKAGEAKAWAKKKATETRQWVSDKWTAFTDYVTGKEEPKKTATPKKTVAQKQPAKTKDTSYRNKVYKEEYYTGKPKYAEWSPEHRVSPVLTTEIYDFTAPFLKEQQELLAQKEAEEKARQEALLADNKVKTDKFNKKVSEGSRAAQAPEKTKKKAKTTTRTNTPQTTQTQQTTR